jgi:alanine racemase
MLAGLRALIDHAALRANLAVVRRHAPRSRVWAVIKANAYGHGMVQVAEALADADGFALARVEEAVRLREAGVRKPLLVLEGAASAEELEAADRNRLELAVHQEEQVALLDQCRLTGPLRLWLKVDTGMHRLGLRPEAVPSLLERLRDDPRVDPPVGLMTHLANADDPADGLTISQCCRLTDLARGGPMPLSIGNSAGILACPESRTDWVRPGIMLYGASPVAGRAADEFGLRPVMTLRSRLIAVKRLSRGDAVGYGGTYVCPEAMPVGVVGIGYGDGYPRQAPTGTPVSIRGREAPLVGRVSMDMITVDLRPVPEAAVGDEVTLWGEGLSVDRVAELAGTISYELLCRVTRRVRFEHANASPSDTAVS